MPTVFLYIRSKTDFRRQRRFFLTQRLETKSCLLFLTLTFWTRCLKCHALDLSIRDGRFSSKVGQIGPKWDKSGDFSDQISVHLARGRICPIWGQSDPLWSQIYHPCILFMFRTRMSEMTTNLALNCHIFNLSHCLKANMSKFGTNSNLLVTMYRLFVC